MSQVNPHIATVSITFISSQDFGIHSIHIQRFRSSTISTMVINILTNQVAQKGVHGGIWARDYAAVRKIADLASNY